MNNVFTVTNALTHANWNTISRIIICDDVLTTGATLDAAKATLSPHLPAHVEIVCLAWAH